MSPKSQDDIDFGEALEHLVAEANKVGAAGAFSPQKAGPAFPSPPPAPSGPAAHPPAKADPSDFSKTIKPLVMAIDALVRTAAENARRLARVEESLAQQADLAGLTSRLLETAEGRGNISRAMFDALHAELRGYKDSFLLDLLQRPVVRDLIVLFDDLSQQHGELSEYLAKSGSGEGAGAPCREKLRTVAENIDHSAHTILEMLARVEVEIVPRGCGKLQRDNQKAVLVEATDNPGEDGDIVRSIKPGFLWRGRVFRPEEVAVKKYKEGYLVAMDDPGASG